MNYWSCNMFKRNDKVIQDMKKFPDKYDKVVKAILNGQEPTVRVGDKVYKIEKVATAHK